MFPMLTFKGILIKTNNIVQKQKKIIIAFRIAIERDMFVDVFSC